MEYPVNLSKQGATRQEPKAPAKQPPRTALSIGLGAAICDGWFTGVKKRLGFSGGGKQSLVFSLFLYMSAFRLGKWGARDRVAMWSLEFKAYGLGCVHTETKTTLKVKVGFNFIVLLRLRMAVFY